MKFLSLSVAVAGMLAAACTVKTTSTDDDDDDSSQAGAGNQDEGTGGTSSSSAAGAGGEAPSTGGSETTAGQGGAAGGENTEAAGAGGEGTGGAGQQNLAGAGGAAGGENQNEAGTANGGVSGESLLDCGSREVTDATVVEDDLNEDVTWSGVVHVTRSVKIVSGATLTLEPGTQVIMADSALLDVGWNGNTATLIADGTEEAPIKFCGERDLAGFWAGVRIGDNVSAATVFRNVLLSDAGAAETALSLGADVQIDNLQVRNSGSDGVRARDFVAGGERLSVTGAKGVAVLLTSSDAMTEFPVGGVFEDNTDNVVSFDLTGISEDTTFHALPIPYRQEKDIRVTGSAHLVFEAGVDYQFEAGTGFEFGWNGAAASVALNGTSEAPIVLRGATEQSGYWKGLIFRDNVATSSLLSHVNLRHAGSGGDPALLIQSAILLSDVSLDVNDTGVRIDEQGLDPDSSDLSITGTDGVPLVVSPDALVTLPQGGDYTGNDVDEIEVQGGDYTVSGTVPNLDVPYRVMSTINARSGAKMTLAAGTQWLMEADSALTFANGTTFIAQGTEAAPIRFEGADQVAGSWKGITLAAEVTSNSKFDYFEIGHCDQACLTLHRAISVAHSEFFDSAGYGILKDAADSTDYETGNTFTNMATGNVGDL
ncbi:MAG: hypothetical protein JW940_27695 [Polyangiaceae bacterium]|nr:hypothetical protein [Polyangiaceae bacterium]